MGSEPPNFSWVLPGRLAGLALPRFPAHYQFLWTQGVRHLVSLTERGPPYSDTCPGLTVHRLRIPDFCPPAPEQIDRFVSLVDEANARGECVIQWSCERLKLKTLGLRRYRVFRILSPLNLIPTGCGGALHPGLWAYRHHAGLLSGKGERPGRGRGCG
ncbi:dual specificity protein phosphatase 23 isoform X1 [Notamacropus eugenii]|uniref:dual specificity protein phosphatase 23 isoform X1 n=1 Tax=Notamacropus eugenii TaxID=9315 RepID=UPI003B67523D